MTFITDPTNIPGITFYEITVSEMDEGDFHVSAKNLTAGVAVVVDEVRLGSGYIDRGEVTIEDAQIRLDYQQHEDESELRVTFVNQ